MTIFYTYPLQNQSIINYGSYMSEFKLIIESIQ